jgi:hypothetical protein
MSNRILRHIGLSIAVVALLALSGEWLHAQAPQGKGSVSGTILTEDGKPAASLSVQLKRTIPIALPDAPGGRRKGRTSGWDSGATGLQGDKQGGEKTIGRATTDANGKFKIENIDSGAANLVAGSKSMGWLYYPVVIEPNKNVDIGEIKLAKVD